MKKIIIFIVLFVLMIGCKDEVIDRTPVREPFAVDYSTEEILDRPVFKLKRAYEGKQSLNIKEYVEYEGELILKLNGEVVSGETLELDYGDHDLIAYYKVKDTESPYVFWSVTITENLGYLELELYDKPYGSSTIAYRNQFKTHDVDEIHYYNTDDGLDTWYYVENSKIKGYVKILDDISRVDRSVFICENGQFVIHEKPYQVKVKPNFFLIESQSNSYIVNSKNADFIEGRRFQYSPDTNFMLPERWDKTVLYRVDGDQLEKVFEHDWEDRDVYHTFREDKILINIDVSRDDIPGVLDYDFQEQYEIDLSTFKMSHVKNKRFDKLNVYADRRLDSRLIGTRTVDSLKGIIPITFASLGVDGVTQWFQIDDGYVAVPVTDQYINMYDYTLVDSLGEMMDITLRVDLYKPLKKGWYSLRAQFRKQYLYNSYKNELMPMLGETMVSPDGKYLIDYQDEESLITFYEYRNNQYTELDEVKLHLNGYLSVEWLEGGEFTFTIAYDDTKKNAWRYITNGMIREKFHMKRTGDKFSYDAGLEPEEVVLYKELNNESEIIATKLDNECSFKPLYTFEMIDDEIHIWFEVMYDDEIGYSHRALHYQEGWNSLFNISTYSFILNDGSIFTYDRDTNEEEYAIIDDFKENGYYALTYSYYGYFYKLISMETGEIVDIPGYVSFSPDKNYICSIQDGIDYSSIIRIFTIDKNSIEQVAEIEVKEAFFYSGTWQDDGSVRVSNEAYDGIDIQTGYVSLIEGKWIFEWDK